MRSFATFLHALWLGKQAYIAPTRLKTLVGEKVTSMFLGYNQHDAQEFMSYFLDAIHEDLNRNENKPIINYDQNEEDAAKELFQEEDLRDESKRGQIETLLRQKAEAMWTQYRLFNNSIVIDLFCGQFKSILTCPDCNKVWW